MKRSASLGFIFITLLVDVLGSGLLVPILPGYIGRLSHHGISAAARDYGWLLSLYGAMQFLFAPLFGALSDRYGRRPILLISLLFTGLDYIIMALAPTLVWLYVGRILSGITGASYTAATAYIADISPPEKRAQNFGLVGAAFGVGFIIGPAAGGLLGAINTRLPFWVAAGLSLANLLYGLFVLPESHAAENRRRFSWRETSPIGAMIVLGKYPIVWGLTGALAAANLGMQCLNSTWVLFTTAKFGWTVRENGIALAAFGLIALVSQVGLSRLLLPQLGERRAMLLGLGVGAIECAAYALVPSGWMIYPVMLLGAIGFISGQATQGLLSRQVSEREQGALQGALASLASVTGILGPVIGSSVFAYFTSAQAPMRLPGAPFLLTAVLNILALGLAVRTLRRKPTARAKT
ncbi:tetracycline resistance MFS efflux pump [Capsulimonas corticalis]|uniref:Tetracycline resistance MFS efflux pump n=2 Tax=Capsulimonas corticalis TaxID=2219043 RepID=A0A402D142_9BACT|nr:tetracycline resistance MFS efflux pump [Capsulimonas corticalis]